MAAPNRSTLLNKAHKVLKKHYKPVPPDGSRPLLEQLLYGACLENAHVEQADRALETLRTTYFDWNEVRVSSVRELSEVLSMLPAAARTSMHLKRILQSVFESTYSFDLETLRKQNLGQAQQRLRKIDGVSQFVVGYVTQASLGGHAIPVDRGTLEALVVLGIVTPQEAAEGNVPGIERAIAKSKGVEFGSLLHQLGADFLANPLAPALHKLLLEIAPDCKDRLPTRKQPRPLIPEPTPAPRPPAPAAAEAAAAGTPETAADKQSGKKKPGSGKPAKPEKPERPEKAERPEKPERAEKAERPEKSERAEKAERPEKGDKGEKGERAEKPAAAKKPAPAKKADGKKSEPKKPPSKRSTSAAGLAKRKPR